MRGTSMKFSLNKAIDLKKEIENEISRINDRKSVNLPQEVADLKNNLIRLLVDLKIKIQKANTEKQYKFFGKSIFYYVFFLSELKREKAYIDIVLKGKLKRQDVTTLNNNLTTIGNSIKQMESKLDYLNKHKTICLNIDKEIQTLIKPLK